MFIALFLVFRFYSYYFDELIGLGGFTVSGGLLIVLWLHIRFGFGLLVCGFRFIGFGVWSFGFPGGIFGVSEEWVLVDLLFS